MTNPYVVFQLCKARFLKQFLVKGPGAYRGLMPDVVFKLPPYEVKIFFAHFSLLWDRCVLKIIIRVHRIGFQGRFWLIIAISGFLMGYA